MKSKDEVYALIYDIISKETGLWIIAEKKKIITTRLIEKLGEEGNLIFTDQ